MESPPATTRQAFEEAVGFLLATAERVRPEQWDAPALGELDRIAVSDRRPLGGLTQFATRSDPASLAECRFAEGSGHVKI